MNGQDKENGLASKYRAVDFEKPIEEMNAKIEELRLVQDGSELDLAEEIKKLTSNVQDNEVSRTKIRMKAGLLMGLESASSRAERLARMVSIWDRIPSLEETVQKIDAIGLNDMRSYAEKIAISTKTAMALYGPVGLAPDLSELEKRRAA